MKTTQKPRSPEKIVSSVKASMAFEGLKPSLQAPEIGKEYLEGKITSEVAAIRIKENHTSKFMCHE